MAAKAVRWRLSSSTIRIRLETAGARPAANPARVVSFESGGRASISKSPKVHYLRPRGLGRWDRLLWLEVRPPQRDAPTSNVSLRYPPAELGKCPVPARKRDARNCPLLSGDQDPLMPCSRAYFVNSAVLRIPNLRITFALWKATVLHVI